MPRRVLVFGTFDELHTGHLFFLESAKTLGDTLTVSVARDGHVRALKNKEPKQDEQTRLQNIRLIPEVDDAMLSDEVIGSFVSLNQIKPDLIVLGYDQDELARAILDWSKTSGFSVPVQRIPKQDYVFQTCTNCSCDH